MNKIILLTKIFTKNSIKSLVENKKNTNLKQKQNTILMYLIAFVYLGITVSGFSYSLIESLKEVGQEKVFIGLVFLIIAVIALIQTIFSAMSLMYYSKDNEYILPLPIKPKQNLNLIWPMILGITNIMIAVAFTSLMPMDNAYIITGGLIVLYIIAGAVVKEYLRKNINKQFEKIY